MALVNQRELWGSLSVGGSPGKAICLSFDVAPQFMNQGYRKQK
jgi:hypothetical protein